MRLTPQQRALNEKRIRAAASRLLSGDIPPGGRCDVKTLARLAEVDRAAFYGTRPYAALREDFERRVRAPACRRHHLSAPPAAAPRHARNQQTRRPSTSKEPRDDPPPSARRPAGRRRRPARPRSRREPADGHRYWLTRPDFADEYIDTFPGITDGTAMAAVCWPEAVAALDRGQLSGSGSETRILRLAASLADGIPVDLQGALSNLDDTNLDYVVTAIRHAAGRRPDHDQP